MKTKYSQQKNLYETMQLDNKGLYFGRYTYNYLKRETISGYSLEIDVINIMFYNFAQSSQTHWISLVTRKSLAFIATSTVYRYNLINYYLI